MSSVTKTRGKIKLSPSLPSLIKCNHGNGFEQLYWNHWINFFYLQAKINKRLEHIWIWHCWSNEIERKWYWGPTKIEDLKKPRESASMLEDKYFYSPGGGEMVLMYKRYSQTLIARIFLKRVRTGSIEQDKTGVWNRKTKKKSGPQLDLYSGRKNSFSLERVLQAWCALRSLLWTFARSRWVGHNFPLSTFAAAEWLYVRDNTAPWIAWLVRACCKEKGLLRLL